ncbi:unnamed protein product [Prunus armeniaca]|uniref:HMA domain-containing protein n=1 Tax=Prunus armeniaca TaxID=36596 RepID=A0A6J5UPI8_PRUAR|nr:unnamed protein product [Prunus armeniaca]
MESRSYMTCGVKIDTNSDGWHKCLTKMLKKIQGASYNVDAEGGMAYVSGKVNPRKLIRRLVKAGKEAELCWVRTGDEFTYGNGNGNGSGYYEGQRYYDPSSSNYMGLTAGPNYYNMNGNYGHGYYSSYSHHHGHPMNNYYPQAPYSYNYY